MQGHTHAGQFPNTSWTQITVAMGDDTQARSSLEMICRLYWGPLYVFCRRSGMNPEESEDLTQAFFVHLLEEGALRRADKEKGKLRTFLLASMKNYLLNWRRAEHAVKRGGRLQRVDFDTREVEAVCSSGGIDSVSPDALYERRWAVTLLDHAMTDLELEHIRAGKGSQFAVLQEFLLLHGKEASYADAAVKLSQTENHVRVTVHRLRKRYRELVKLHVASTVETAEEVEDELRHLMSLF